MRINDNDVKIIELETDGDHVHVLMECKPQHRLTNIVKAFKGVSARLLFRDYPELKKVLYGGNLWNPSYFVSTVSENSEEQIKKYIQEQKKE